MSEQKQIFIRWFSLWVILQNVNSHWMWIDWDNCRERLEMFTFRTLSTNSLVLLVYCYHEPFRDNLEMNFSEMKIQINKFLPRRLLRKRLRSSSVQETFARWLLNAFRCRMLILNKPMSPWRCNFNQLAIRLRPSLTSSYQYNVLASHSIKAGSVESMWKIGSMKYQQKGNFKCRH